MEETNNTNNSKVIWLTVVFAVVIIGGMYSFGYNPLSFFNREKPQVTKVSPEGTPSTTTVEQSVASLESRITFPKKNVESSTVSNVVELGNELSPLIITESTSQQIKKEVYEDGSKGWSVSYRSADNVMNVYNDVYSAVSKGGFKIGLASRTFNAAIISADNSKYTIKIIAEYIDDTNAVVKISVLDK